MIIDTEKIRQQIHERDDKLFPNVNWDTCSMSFLNQREKAAVDDLKLIDEIESLANYLDKLFSNNSGHSTKE